MTISKIIELQREFKEAYQTTGVISITKDYVQMTADYFLETFANWDYLIGQMDGSINFQRKIVINDVEFIAVVHKSELTAKEMELLGIEDDF